jgi:uncharacterized protein YjbI with pentapeptide repeats
VERENICVSVYFSDQLNQMQISPRGEICMANKSCRFLSVSQGEIFVDANFSDADFLMHNFVDADFSDADFSDAH